MEDSQLKVYAPIGDAFKKGKGSTLWDTQNKSFIDFSAGVAVNALGHCHPKLVDTIQQQSKKLWHVSNYWHTEEKSKLCDTLREVSFADKVFLCNSGAEANEAALKLARRVAYKKGLPNKTGIVAFKKGFHGRTFFTVTAGGTAKYSSGFGPNPSDITHGTYNDCDSARLLINSSTCAVIVEPMLGEGGVHPATRAFLATLKRQCEQHNALLIFDEVQTGIGRTGKLFMYQHFNIQPDIMTLAKGLGAGFPIGAMLCTNKDAQAMEVGSHGSTFGGNPLACAVASTVLDTVNDYQFLKAVADKEAKIRSWLSKSTDAKKIFSNIRGQGLLLALVFDKDFEASTEQFIKLAHQKGLLCLPCNDPAIRLAPALNISDTELTLGLAILDKCCKALNDIPRQANATETQSEEALATVN